MKTFTTVQLSKILFYNLFYPLGSWVVFVLILGILPNFSKGQFYQAPGTTVSVVEGTLLTVNGEEIELKDSLGNASVQIVRINKEQTKSEPLPLAKSTAKEPIPTKRKINSEKTTQPEIQKKPAVQLVFLPVSPKPISSFASHHNFVQAVILAKKQDKEILVQVVKLADVEISKREDLLFSVNQIISPKRIKNRILTRPPPFAFLS